MKIVNRSKERRIISISELKTGVCIIYDHSKLNNKVDEIQPTDLAYLFSDVSRLCRLSEDDCGLIIFDIVDNQCGFYLTSQPKSTGFVYEHMLGSGEATLICAQIIEMHNIGFDSALVFIFEFINYGIEHLAKARNLNLNEIKETKEENT